MAFTTDIIVSYQIRVILQELFILCIILSYHLFSHLFSSPCIVNWPFRDMATICHDMDPLQIQISRYNFSTIWHQFWGSIPIPHNFLSSTSSSFPCTLPLLYSSYLLYSSVYQRVSLAYTHLKHLWSMWDGWLSMLLWREYYQVRGSLHKT